MSESVSRTLVQQRVRNRLIEYFEIAASIEDIAKFGAHEVINMWEDWVRSPNSDFFAEPVFSRDEQAGIRDFQQVWEAWADQCGEDIFDANALRAHVCVNQVAATATDCLKVFEKRGRFSEDREIF